MGDLNRALSRTVVACLAARAFRREINRPLTTAIATDLADGQRLAFAPGNGRLYVAAGEGSSLWTFVDAEGFAGAPSIVPGDDRDVLVLDGRSYRFQIRFGDGGGLGAPSAEQPFFTAAP